MTVVGLHGFAGTPAQWEGLVDVAPWLPGHGPRAVEHDFEAAVAAIAREVPSGATLAGYSLGARLALAVALAVPERVERLVLVGGTAGIEDPEERSRRQAWDEAQAAAIEGDLDRWVDRWERLPIFAGQSPELVAAQRPSRRCHTPSSLAWAMRALGQGRMPSLWHAVPRCPPLRLVVGARDPKYLALAKRIAALAPDAELTVAPDVGHNVLLEAPAVVARQLR